MKVAILFAMLCLCGSVFASALEDTYYEKLFLYSNCTAQFAGTGFSATGIDSVLQQADRYAVKMEYSAAEREEISSMVSDIFSHQASLQTAYDSGNRTALRSEAGAVYSLLSDALGIYQPIRNEYMMGGISRVPETASDFSASDAAYRACLAEWG
ncbi:hypothetical protein GF415_00725 [Candidatus Micrarchaeota archaeon]|nr:hypothetical protein [Candidatus Micrarchaeota archaeon]